MDVGPNKMSKLLSSRSWYNNLDKNPTFLTLSYIIKMSLYNLTGTEEFVNLTGNLHLIFDEEFMK
eukprot:gnl/Chilomastix_caulleri/3915.p2 GENE.gnl/Chilomastix_caulleri/3915~~gnl/Chilomastix_caulleri/3915.p2  ORF type:complete len:65 (-),score=13.72 gnl/Chilomastix_caulleri/3915:228-422(-)